ncbi:uncharacterized protein LOC130565206 [Triplophysa rosa]|uniref:uncharacterized protein LOC130565206 n=1 Tax=Triplophysa rosa TaxID=992332 RepID=UPI0025460071|nr:uncharacterized protein LOC130565206 [Triplophysa rosa]
MYCPYCGFKFGVLPKFCSSCGKNLEVLKETRQETISAVSTDNAGNVNVTGGADSTPTPTLNQFLEYRKLKSKEKTNFSLSMKGGNKHEQKKVQINVGIMCLQNGCLKPQRGKTLPLYTDPQVTANDVLRLAEKKFKDFNKDMEEGPYFLLYPDGSVVVNVPGTQKPFTLKDYKSEIGKTYQRINLFICRKSNFEAEQILSSDSDTEVVIRTRNSDESNLADTLPITPQHSSTPEKAVSNKIDCAVKPPQGNVTEITLSDSEDDCPSTSDHVAKENQCYREYMEVYAPATIEEEELEISAHYFDLPQPLEEENSLTKLHLS